MYRIETMGFDPPKSPANRFDQAAAAWDDKPQRVILARRVAEAIQSTLPLHNGMTALEYGCGTGLVCRALSPLLGQVTALDTSSNMLEQLQNRLDEEGIANISPLLHDLTEAPLADGPFDLIMSSMVLHHIADLPSLTARLLALLRPGGWLAIADLAPEDGSFHDDNTGVVHHGIDPDQLVRIFAAHGGVRAHSKEIHAMEKNGRRYPIFLAWCEKG